MLTALDRHLSWVSRARPYTAALGWCRSLLALGTLGTLVLTPPEILFSYQLGDSRAVACGDVRAGALVCLVEPGHVRPLVTAMCLVLLFVVAGYLPRYTAIPHWWISWTVVNSSVPDGGDQLAAILTLVLLPVVLLDGRRWHWRRQPGRSGFYGNTVASICVQVARLQIAVVYFQSSLSKLGRTDWAEGTALYYWFNDTTFGLNEPFTAIGDWISGSAAAVHALSWGVVGVELFVAMSLLMSRAARRVALVAGAALHTVILLTMGLTSFSLVMFGALALLCLGSPLDMTVRRNEPGTQVPEPSPQSRPLVSMIGT